MAPPSPLNYRGTKLFLFLSLFLSCVSHGMRRPLKCRPLLVQVRYCSLPHLGACHLKKYHRRKKWNVNPLRSLVRDKKLEATTMRGVLLWLLGVPISVIILLYLFHVI